MPAQKLKQESIDIGLSDVQVQRMSVGQYLESLESNERLSQLMDHRNIQGHNYTHKGTFCDHGNGSLRVPLVDKIPRSELDVSIPFNGVEISKRDGDLMVDVANMFIVGSGNDRGRSGCKGLGRTLNLTKQGKLLEKEGFRAIDVHRRLLATLKKILED